MKTYLIDLENVQSFGIQGLSALSARDEIYIFYSEKARSINITIVKDMIRNRHNIKFFRLNKPGSNAMDFQIVSLLGILIGRRRHGEYYIVSGDSGYDAAIDFIKREFPAYNVSIKRVSSISKSMNIKEHDLIQDNQEWSYHHHHHRDIQLDTDGNNSKIKLELLNYLRNTFDKKFADNNFVGIVECIGSSATKNELHNKLCNYFGQCRGNIVYKDISEDYSNFLKPRCIILLNECS